MTAGNGGFNLSLVSDFTESSICNVRNGDPMVSAATK